jgi:hypothetical protein
MTLNEVWKNYGFEIAISLALLLIAVHALCRVGKSGSWSKYNTYDVSINKRKPATKRGPPKESSGEKECRRVLETLFKKPFPNIRPDFLQNPVTGNRRLEIDCFNEELGLGIEYNGVQHYKFVPFFHKNKETFMNQKYRDNMKRGMCKQNGIILIEVPYTVKTKDISAFLVDELMKSGFTQRLQRSQSFWPRR